MSAVDEGTILRRFFALVAVAVIVGLSAPPARADVVLASDFGPGDTFQTSTGTAWAIGASQSDSVAVAFIIPAGQTYQLTQFRFAANWFAGTNTLNVGFFVGSDLNTATLLESFTFSASAFRTPQLFTAVSTAQPLLIPGNMYFTHSRSEAAFLRPPDPPRATPSSSRLSWLVAGSWAARGET